MDKLGRVSGLRLGFRLSVSDGATLRFVVWCTVAVLLQVGLFLSPGCGRTGAILRGCADARMSGCTMASWNLLRASVQGLVVARAIWIKKNPTHDGR